MHTLLLTFYFSCVGHPAKQPRPSHFNTTAFEFHGFFGEIVSPFKTAAFITGFSRLSDKIVEKYRKPVNRLEQLIGLSGRFGARACKDHFMEMFH